MNTYAIRVDIDDWISLHVCKAHSHAMPSAGQRVVIRPAPRDAACEVCRQDKIRAAIRSVNAI